MLLRLARALAKLLPERMPEPLAEILAKEIAAHLAPRVDALAVLMMKHGAGSRQVKIWLTTEIIRGLVGEDAGEALKSNVNWQERIESAQWELIDTSQILGERDDEEER